jgi:hypothetical protein
MRLLVILIILGLNIHGFLIFPFTAQHALNVFYKSIKNDETIDENVMRHSIAGQMCLRECGKGHAKVCYFKFIIKYYQVLSGYVCRSTS